MADREQSVLTRFIQQLAESGDHAGFYAIIRAIEKDVDPQALESLKRDSELRQRITDVCHDSWQRKHAR